MIGEIAGRVLAVGWSLITFLAVPVIALEGAGPLATLKRSASLFRSRWGQQVTGNVAIGAAVFLFGMLPSILLIVIAFSIWASASFLGALLLVIGVIGMADPTARLQGADGHIRRRPLPLRARGTGGRRLHRRGARVGGQAARRPQRAADGDPRHDLTPTPRSGAPYPRIAG